MLSVCGQWQSCSPDAVLISDFWGLQIKSVSFAQTGNILRRPSFSVLQLPWPAILKTWSEGANTVKAPEQTSNCGSPRNQAWTPFCTEWMKTWRPRPTASTKSLSATWRACPPTLPTPSLCTSCPALTLWPVSCILFPALSVVCLWRQK